MGGMPRSVQAAFVTSIVQAPTGPLLLVLLIRSYHLQ
jgi:hypothetical protein